MSPDYGSKLLLVVSIFCFNGVFGSGRGTKVAAISGLQGIESQKSSLLHHKGRRSGFFDVMSFGARADGQTDDIRVCFPLSLKQRISLLVQNSWNYPIKLTS
jgi:hypothetical protein